MPPFKVHDVHWIANFVENMPRVAATPLVGVLDVAQP
jgi:hypothetical protein